MFAQRLKELRKQRGLTQKKLAELVHVDCSAVTKWETGIAKPDFEKQPLLAKILGTTTDYLFGLDDNPSPKRKGVRIPVLGKVAAGIPLEAIEEILDYEEIEPELAATGEFFALQIGGDSMEPKLSKGDVVIVRKQEDVNSGDIAIVLVNGNDATCKKVIKHENGGVTLISYNPKYTPMFYTADEVSSIPIRIIGKAIELRAKL